MSILVLKGRGYIDHKCGVTRQKHVLQYNTVKPNLKGPVDLLWFRESFGFKKAKIKKRKISDLIYLSVHPIVWFKRFRFNRVILYLILLSFCF